VIAVAITDLGREPGDESRETFEQHMERMRRFRRLHDLAGHNKSTRISSIPPVEANPAAEPPEIRPSLLKIGYILNLIQKRGTVLLPRNWQN
jgi:hypothetical protein